MVGLTRPPMYVPVVTSKGRSRGPEIDRAAPVEIYKANLLVGGVRAHCSRKFRSARSIEPTTGINGISFKVTDFVQWRASCHSAHPRCWLAQEAGPSSFSG